MIMLNYNVICNSVHQSPVFFRLLTSGMPQSERESDKRVSGRENERQPPLKEERDASPPLLNESSSPQHVEHLSSGVRSVSELHSVVLSVTMP